jgi:trimeric autotransporter adhesin
MPSPLPMFCQLLTVLLSVLLSPLSFAAAPNNGYWQGFGGVPGCNGTVFASAALPTGELIFGGEFSMCDNVKLSNIGVYTPSTGRWRRLGTLNANGTDGKVFALSVIGNTIYVGGTFTRAGSAAIDAIARVDATTGSWSPVGNPVASGSVYALLAVNNELYVGGDFTTIGGAAAVNIAKWDGSAWSSLLQGVNSNVQSLANLGSRIYAGGAFTVAGSVNANRVAEWNGTAWSALGAGFSNPVGAICVYNNEVHVGSLISGAPSISRWNGSSWVGVSTLGNIVRAMRVVDNKLIVVGTVRLLVAGNVTAGAFSWDGSTLSPLGFGTNSATSDVPGGYTIINSGSQIYIGGQFSEGRNTATSSEIVSNIARWDGSQWHPLSAGNAANASVHALHARAGSVYAAGNFNTLGNILSPLVGAWNGSWSATRVPFGSTAGTGTAFASSATELYLTGAYRLDFGITAGTARYTGTAWQALAATGVGFNDRIRAAAIKGSNLYVGGTFTSIGGVAANNIARWDGTAWNALGAGVNGNVNAIEPAFGANNSILVGGDFTLAGGLSAFRIARWDGTATWSAIGSGVNGPVFAIKNAFLEIAVGGSFSSAGGVPANNISRLSGNTFSAYGQGTTGPVRALTFSAGSIWAGGEFVAAGNTNANNIARWDIGANDWAPLGFGAAVGTDKPVLALTIDGNTVYVGGDFVLAGDGASAHIARFVLDNNQLMSTGFEGQ